MCIRDRGDEHHDPEFFPARRVVGELEAQAGHDQSGDPERDTRECRLEQKCTHVQDLAKFGQVGARCRADLWCTPGGGCPFGSPDLIAACGDEGADGVVGRGIRRLEPYGALVHVEALELRSRCRDRFRAERIDADVLLGPHHRQQWLSLIHI